MQQERTGYFVLLYDTEDPRYSRGWEEVIADREACLFSDEELSHTPFVLLTRFSFPVAFACSQAFAFLIG